MMADDRLVIKNLNKSYAAPVLHDVDLVVGRGQIHAIVGENGAGKTTLARILAGLTTRDSGALLLNQERYDPHQPTDAFLNGVSMAAQELSAISTLTIAENLQLRRLPSTNGVIKLATLADTATAALEKVGLGRLDTGTLAGDLSLAERQLLEFAKAILDRPGLLLLDEPTAALTRPQADRLHALIREVAEQGTSVIYISHRLEDVLNVADVVSVLRDGRLVASGPANDFSADDLVRHMAGDVFAPVKRSAPQRGDTLLRIEDVMTADLPHPVSLDLGAGEIVGLAGLEGAGRSELLHAGFGLVPLMGGQVTRLTESGAVSVDSARTAVAAGMAMLGEDRQATGLYRGLSVRDNMMLPGKPTENTMTSVIDQRLELSNAEKLINRVGVRCRGPEQDIAELSGGNQQKALLARWLNCESEVFLLDEPTRGVDVATKSAIYDLLRELASDGCGVVVASSEIEELMTVSDRILVLSNRQIVEAFVRPNWSETAILSAAFSGFQNNARASSQ